jgi:hypothetical protein
MPNEILEEIIRPLNDLTSHNRPVCEDDIICLALTCRRLNNFVLDSRGITTLNEVRKDLWIPQETHQSLISLYGTHFLRYRLELWMPSHLVYCNRKRKYVNKANLRSAAVKAKADVDDGLVKWPYRHPLVRHVAAGGGSLGKCPCLLWLRENGVDLGESWARYQRLERLACAESILV